MNKEESKIKLKVFKQVRDQIWKVAETSNCKFNPDDKKSECTHPFELTELEVWVIDKIVDLEKKVSSD